MSKLDSIIDLFSTVGINGGRALASFLVLPILFIGVLLWGFFSLNLMTVFLSLPILGVTLLLGFPTYRLMASAKKERLNNFDKLIGQIEFHEPYNNIYRFEPPRQYEHIQLNSYLPVLRRHLLAGAQAEVLHIESSNNLVLNVWFGREKPKCDGLWYVS